MSNSSNKSIYLTFSAFGLMLAEVYGYEIKSYKYYHCVTLLTYEFIWILTIVAYYIFIAAHVANRRVHLKSVPE